MTQQEQWDIVTGVGITALAVAGARAAETRRTDRLVEDPFARPLVEAAGGPESISGQLTEAFDQEHWETMTGYIAVRSRFFDDFFDKACAAGAQQAVILASGLDTRAYRLSWPKRFRLFEIDQPLVLEFKDTTLADLDAQAACERRAVPVDLREDWASALKDAGFDPNLPTAWLAEGLLPYLPRDAEQQLIESMHALSAPGSRMSIESIPDARSALDDPELQEASRDWGIDVTTLFSTEDRPDPVDTLSGLGWSVRHRPAAVVAAELGRDLSGSAQRIGGSSEMLTAVLPH